MRQLIILFALTAYILAQGVTKIDLPKKVTSSGKFEEGNTLPSIPIPQKVFFEQFDGYFGYITADKKGVELKIRPDLTATSIVVGDDSAGSNWGFKCTADNSCTLSSNTCAAGASYLGVQYTCTKGSTNLYFNKDQKYSDFGTVSLDVEFTPLNNSTWPLANTALVGMAPDSTFINYLVQNFNFGSDKNYELNFFYDIQKKDDRYAADASGTFDITMINFGQNKDNLQDDSGKYVRGDSITGQKYWGFTTKSIDGLVGGNDVEVLTTGNQYTAIANAGNAYFALGSDEMVKMMQIINSAAGCTADASTHKCKADDVDQEKDALNTTYVNVNIAIKDNKNLKLKVPVKDLIYKKKDVDELQYSLANIADWQALGVVDNSVSVAVGRQFQLNTYVVFQVDSDGNKYVYLGQLNDMGKITGTERLWLMLFGCLMVLIILVALLVKILRRNKEKGGKTGDQYVRHES